MESYAIAPDGDVTLVIRNPNNFFASWITPPAAEETTEPLSSTIDTPDSANAADETELEVVKPPPVDEVRFRVSSAHLMLGSPYFKSSLTGPWREAEALRAHEPIEMHCLSWDTEAMLIFLRILHAQPWKLPDTVETELLAKLAVVADYYGCQRLVKYYATEWIAPVDMEGPVEGMRALYLGLWISWFFRHSHNFMAYSSLIIQHAKTAVDHYYGLPIPSSVIDALNKRRIQELDHVFHRIHEEREKLLDPNGPCTETCRTFMLGALIRNLHEHNMLDVSPAYKGLSLVHMVWHLKFCIPPHWKEASLEDKSVGPYTYHSCPYSTFVGLFGDLSYRVGGLQLDEFRECEGADDRRPTDLFAITESLDPER
ncbi:hypothetical protein BJY00DRAFT_311996 [Aspergillus carlsbadensis]|nr:hypothetical protein BJY00DRAFT_311996 [Aspergillus carlsbadensis]